MARRSPERHGSFSRTPPVRNFAPLGTPSRSGGELPTRLGGSRGDRRRTHRSRSLAGRARPGRRNFDARVDPAGSARFAAAGAATTVLDYLFPAQARALGTISATYPRLDERSYAVGTRIGRRAVPRARRDGSAAPSRGRRGRVARVRRRAFPDRQQGRARARAPTRTARGRAALPPLAPAAVRTSRPRTGDARTRRTCPRRSWRRRPVSARAPSPSAGCSSRARPRRSSRRAGGSRARRGRRSS